LKALALMRLEDARLLEAARHDSAAYYLAGYAVECGLKAIIARSFRESVIPDRNLVNRIYSHNLNELVALPNLRPALDARIRISDGFRANWSFVSDWNEASRYEIVDLFMAELMIHAVGSEPDGVIPWLKEHW
jgi:HEPN domain-containing protein